MFVSGVLRILSFFFFLVLLVAPPRYVLLHPRSVYYTLVISYMIIGVLRLRRVQRSRLVSSLLVAYSALPFVWMAIRVASAGELFDSLIAFSMSSLWLLASVSLPVALLVEFVLPGRSRGRQEPSSNNMAKTVKET